jgi:hypothetical protein
MTTNWLGSDTHERLCNGAQIMLISFSVFWGPQLMAPPVDATPEVEGLYQVGRSAQSAGSAAFGLSGVCH